LPPPRPTLFPYTTLFRSGYTALKQAGVKPKRPDFPDLRVGNHRERYPSVGGFAPTTPRPEPIEGAKAFPVGHSHKQGMELILPRSEEHTSELQSRENLVC